jgi:hypothetical protein
MWPALLPSSSYLSVQLSSSRKPAGWDLEADAVAAPGILAQHGRQVFSIP